MDPGEFAERRLACSLYSDPVPQTSVSGAVRVARAGPTSLIAMNLRCTTTFVAVKNQVVEWDEGYDKVYPNTHPGAWLDRPWVAMLLLVHPDGASPAVIGFRGNYVL